MIEILSEAIKRINDAGKDLAIAQREFSFNLQKLLLAIQANEALNCRYHEIGCEKELISIYNLCAEAQNLDITQYEELIRIGQKVDELTAYVIENT